MIKNFKIHIISKKPKKIETLLSHTNEIIIGNYKETSPMPITEWTVEDYKHQWQNAIERIKTHNESCIVVAVYGLKTQDPRIWIWKLYKSGNKIFFQNQLLMNDSIKEMNISIKLSDFSPSNYYQFISPRVANENNEGIDEEGIKLFEKSIEIE